MAASVNDEARIRQALALLADSRSAVIEPLEHYLGAAKKIELWLKHGSLRDRESAAEVSPHVRLALVALSELGGTAHHIAGSAARLADVQTPRVSN